MIPGFDLSTARLTATWQFTGTHQVLAVFDDWTVWVWKLAGLGPGSDVVGSFRARVPESARPAVSAIAGRIGDADDPANPEDLLLRLTSGTETGSVPMGSAAAGVIGQTIEPLLELARRSPIAAVTFAATVLSGPAGEPVAAFSLTSTGSDPVAVLMDPATFRLRTRGEDWWSLPAPRMGLVDSSGQLLDGLYAPAVIPPGGMGVCTFVLTAGYGPGSGSSDSSRSPDSSGSPDSGSTSGRVAASRSGLDQGAISGSIALAGPWDVPPIAPFEASGATVRR